MNIPQSNSTTPANDADLNPFEVQPPAQDPSPDDYIRALEKDVARLLREQARYTNETQDYKSMWNRLRADLQHMQD